MSRANYTIICLYYYPQKVCNFHMQVFQIKLKYHCSKPIKLQKFLMQQYNGGNLINKVVITNIKQRLSVQATYALFGCFCCNSYSYNKLDSWRLQLSMYHFVVLSVHTCNSNIFYSAEGSDREQKGIHIDQLASHRAQRTPCQGNYMTILSLCINYIHLKSFKLPVTSILSSPLFLSLREQGI